MLNAANLSRIDLNLFVLFQVVLEETHVGRAAHRLNLTPSAVSHGLKRLRELLSDPLFLKTPKGVVPTERALALREPIAEILARAQGVVQSAVPFDPTTSRRRFLIGAPDAIIASLAIPLIERLRREAGGLNVGMIHLLPVAGQSSGGQPWADSLRQLEKRELDLAILPMRALPPRFAACGLYAEDFVVAMREGHAFAPGPNLAAFCAAQHLLVSLSGEAYGFVDETLAKRGRSRRIVLTVPSFMMALPLLSQSDLLAVLPRRLVRQYQEMFRLTCAELPFKRKPDVIQAIATKAALADAAIGWLMTLLADLAAARAP
jgi:DNA-binding transcriptional LysR family regulator